MKTRRSCNQSPTSCYFLVLSFAGCLLLSFVTSTFAQEMARPEKRWVRLRPMSSPQRASTDSAGVSLKAGAYFDVLYKMNARLLKRDSSWSPPAAALDSAITKIEALVDGGNYQTAMAALKQLEQRLNANGATAERLRASNLRGAILLGLGEFGQAAAVYRAMINSAKSVGDNYSESVGRGNFGTVHHASGQYALALASYDSALGLAKILRDREGEGIWLGNLGYVSLLLNRYPQALAYYERARDVARAIRDRPGVGRCLGNLGSVYQSMGVYPRAVSYYDSALAIARTNDDPFSEGIWLGNLGNVYYQLGEYPRAIGYYESALQLSRTLGDRDSEGTWLDGLGNVYYSLVQWGEATAYYDSAIAMARAIGDRRAEGIRLGNLGNLNYVAGQHEQAIAHLDSALAISRAIGDREAEGTHLGNLGNVYHKLGQFPRALESLHRALALAREIGDRKGEGTWLGDLSTVHYAMEQFPQAIACADSALAVALDIADSEYIWRSYLSLARSHARMPSARRNQVIDFYDKAMEALEEVTERLIQDVHKLSFLEDKQALYRDYISYLIRQPEKLYQEKALEVSETSRTRALLDLLQGQRTQASLTVEKRMAAMQRTAELLQSSGESSAVEAAPDVAMRASAEEVVESWASGLHIPADTLGSTEGAPRIGMREVKAEAKANTLLEYHVLETGIVIWVCTTDGEFHAATQLIPRQQLIMLVDSARQALGVPHSYGRNIQPVTPAQTVHHASFKPILQTLDSLLIQPVVRYLPPDSSHELVILPHDILFLLPFSCLMDSSGKYLVERYSMAIAPSVGLLKFTRGRIREQQNRDKPTLLLMGNPQMPDPEIWPALPGAEQEVKRIAQQVNEKMGSGFQAEGALPLHALALTGAQATEANFRQIAGIQNYVHLATHGYLVSDALRCGLILAKTGETMEMNGILTTAEIFGLPLNAELVVLSACQTGLGQISSDGVAGLTRAFLYAGASSLIVSLWKVSDEATQQLMVKFYEELARNGNKALALRAAQLATLKKYPQPKDWASFVLVGQPK